MCVYVSMATAIRNMHEMLGPYLSSASPPTAVSAPSGTQTRLPVGPAGAIPAGLRPIPTTTQSNKKTNAQIPYMRRATETQGVGGVWEPSVAEGSIAFVEHQSLVPRHQTNGKGPNQFVDVYSVEQINAEIKQPRSERYTYETFPYRLDGVVNNVDGADARHEFRDYTIVNMAVQGQCRLDHSPKTRADLKKTHIGSVIYVGLFGKDDPDGGKDAAGRTLQVHELRRFSSAQCVRINFFLDLEEDGFDLASCTVAIWKVGIVVDPLQSHEMMSIHVDADVMRSWTDADVQNSDNYANDGSGVWKHVLRWKQEWDSATRRYVTTPAVFGEEGKARDALHPLYCKWLMQEGATACASPFKRHPNWPPNWRTTGYLLPGP